MIRQLQSNDKQLTELSQTCFQELRAIYSPNKLARERKALAKNDCLSFGYFIAEQLVACIDVSLATDGELDLSALAVSKKYRRQGIAGKLIFAVMEKFADIKRVSLWCVKQTGNVQIFEALGFKVVQELESELFNTVNGDKAIEVQLTLPVTV